MKIVDIDAPYELLERLDNAGVIEWQRVVLKTIRHLERECFRYYPTHRIGPNVQLPEEPIWKFENNDYENMAFLVHTIPIYLRCDKPKKDYDGNCIIDLLGAYFNNKKDESPYIELYLTNIANAAGNDDLEFEWLVVFTLIHELAHAALDIFNCSYNSCQIEKVSYHTEFGRWREESMANAMALRVIKDSRDKSFYEYVKQFALTQPPEYALGVKMVNFGSGDFKSVVDGKEKGVDVQLQNGWLNYVNGNPNWKGLKGWNYRLQQ